MESREKFSSRLGFILISAGCAIGLGNVWRFPYIVGRYGGAAFVLIYLFFLVIMGLPIMIMEFAIGRASQKSVALSFDRLEPEGTKWHWYKWPAMAGNYILMMFYTTIGGWMLLYFVKMVSGQFTQLNTEQVQDSFNTMLGQPALMTVCMLVIVVLCFSVCAMGLQKGVEKITKVMMISLLMLMVILAVKAITLPGGKEGLKFYLYPDFKKLTENGLPETIYAALGQAFFTLSIGIGAMAIFGSYIDKKRRLTGEAVWITALDTAVAFIAGLIIFPSCFAFNISPDSGPKLIFVTLPNVFNEMEGGRFWGSLFFLFMGFAAISTIIGVFENLIAFVTDLTGCGRVKSVLINFIAIAVLSMPCILGFNVLSGVQLLGEGSTILDFEDFIVSNNLLPIGSLVYLLFGSRRYGWGWNNFMEEANCGEGLKFPSKARVYVSYILPLILLFIFIWGYVMKFFS